MRSFWKSPECGLVLYGLLWLVVFVLLAKVVGC